MTGVTDFIQRCIAVGMPLEWALEAGKQLEAAPVKIQSKGAARQARYAERQRQKASETSENDVCVIPDAPFPQSEEQARSFNTESNQTPIPPPIVPRPLPKSSFTEFWLAYPNKVGKRAAASAHQRALRRASCAEIMAGLERAKTCRSWAEGYIPHPTTWLNQDRWEDKPDESARAPPMTGGMLAAASDELAFQTLKRKYEQEEHDQKIGNLGGDQSIVRALPAPTNGADGPRAVAR